MEKFYEAQRLRFASSELEAGKVTGKPKDATPEQAAWVVTVRALMNLDEAVTKG